ncbi:putative porin [Nonlabens ponticola]|uniref:Porin n=1 Tax=Nonlabens ponticola TaxID=2496866 RepID=A0A3S9MX64_9FLAO|nr:putative porin [Nonlabens ponticola]AZQ43831.1 hypothetical protein EJ995_06155 [Nonlabens ponticola]
MRYCFFFIVLFSLPWCVSAQRSGGLTPIGQDQDDRPISNKELTVDGEKPPITDYLIISQSRDTTYVDTTLSIQKDYKFNYLRSDDFELMPFQNIGQPYNKLGKQVHMQQIMPGMGANARHDNYYEIDDVYDYYVPTPLTELYFKTAVNQGQQLDAFFTSNLSPQFNFSISYKGMRSAGEYVNTLTSTGNFKFTSNYFTKDKKYRLRLHTTFQDLTNQESGGLTVESLQGFIDEDEDLDDRGRLEPNLNDAESLLEGRRFYIDHDYELLGQKDSTSYYSARIYNTAYFEDKFYRFSEPTPTPGFLGESYVSSGIEGKTNYEHSLVEAGLTYDHYILGYFKAGLARRDYNYGYDRIVNTSNGVVDDRLIGEVYQFKAAFAKRLGVFDFKADGAINFAGDLDGQYLRAAAGLQLKDVLLTASASVNSVAPDFNLQLHQSDYIAYNWQNNFENIKKQQFTFKIDSDKYLDAQVDFTTMQDHAYFNYENVGVLFTPQPVQTDQDITYLKVKVHRGFRFLNHFGSDHTLMYQSVTQQDNIFNVPEFVARNTIYYEGEFFKKALKLQTGVTLKYFSSYFMDAYDPVLGEFYTQDRVELGDYPLVDIFLNAKIQQTRIFFKLEHANSPFADPDYFSAPLHPYRDLTLRFGLVWNFFL